MPAIQTTSGGRHTGATASIGGISSATPGSGRLARPCCPGRSAGAAGERGPWIAAKPFLLSDAAEVHAELPAGWTSGRLHLVLVSDCAVVARSAVDVDVDTLTGHVIGDDRA
ncbi:hypothetical protein ITP53_23635 [Nonomuraea sp. K274]|uniref:Uncharacterized protein n=1 Tax=Nonomuraea cypriaca TaxID=1187855 RepID=A0A931A9A3_9ACTN|nr:hypothetical protein [Nonomuraea cypriaca]MBF8188666.1 hypothetical protein [Nonomuraea cypriaca]